MNNTTFNILVDKRLKSCRDILIKKNDEYSSDTDRLHNFRKAAQIKGCTDIEALDGMWIKHMVSLRDMIDRMADDPEYVPSEDLVTEKLGDIINYTLLFEGLIEDRRENTSKTINKVYVKSTEGIREGDVTTFAEENLNAYGNIYKIDTKPLLLAVRKERADLEEKYNGLQKGNHPLTPYCERNLLLQEIIEKRNILEKLQILNLQKEND